MTSTRRTWLTVFVVMIACVLAGLLFWIIWVRPLEQHYAIAKRLRASLERMALKYPEELTPKQWEFMIGYTKIGMDNCFFAPNYVLDTSRYQRMPAEFDERIEHESGVDVINWIWDECEANSTIGKRYSAQWRPTRPDRLSEAEHTSF